MTSPRVLMSGGGTGGHIFPAIAIAQEIHRRFPDAQFLFIGAESKMEMEKVPQAGFNIVGLDIRGIDRGNKLSNLKLPFKLLKSLFHFRICFYPFLCGCKSFYAAHPGMNPVILDDRSVKRHINKSGD